jgi:diguanylate cyclase (GGDEF)-like protein
MSISLVMLDIDFFKRLNDTYGHQIGDECLKQVAAVLGNALRRAGDVAARYGGEEFAIILPATDGEGATVLAEDLRTRIQALAIPHENSPFGVVTVSMGVASAVPEEGVAPDSLIANADRALYRSKNDGRNRTSIAEEEALTRMDTNSSE